MHKYNIGKISGFYDEFTSSNKSFTKIVALDQDEYAKVLLFDVGSDSVRVI
jgi:hypothetical protein